MARKHCVVVNKKKKKKKVHNRSRYKAGYVESKVQLHTIILAFFAMTLKYQVIQFFLFKNFKSETPTLVAFRLTVVISWPVFWQFAAR